MLPKPIKNSLQGIRRQVIANQLAGTTYDIIFFQEAFSGQFRKTVIEKLKSDYPYSFYLKKTKKIKHVFGSGLLVLSRHPFQVIETLYFDKCGGFDCYASKGAVLLETTLPDGKRIQFATTHLQSKEKLGAVRLYQLSLIKAMLDRRFTVNVPQLLIGDLNIDALEPEPDFAQGLNIMGMDALPLSGPIQHTSSRTNDCYKIPGKNKEWIDHIWISQQATTTRSYMSVKNLEFTYKMKTCPSSDHHALEAQILF